MKKLFVVLLSVLAFIKTNATTYYFANSGNDVNTGTATTSPFKTISKFNSIFGTKLPGDKFLFRRGDIFYGSLNINRSGTSVNAMYIGAYTDPAHVSSVAPAISGLINIDSWVNLGSNIWEGVSADSTAQAQRPQCNMVLINGVNVPMGRFPNTGYFTIDTHSAHASITSSGLSGATNWTGAEVVQRKIAWITDRSVITSQTGTSPNVTLNYTSPDASDAKDGWGFFIQNDTRTLDIADEWYYNPTTKKIRVYSVSSPTSVQISTVDTLVKIQTKSYITFDSLSFIGSNLIAFAISADHVTIQHCTIDYSGVDAIWGGANTSPSGNFVCQNNIINHTNNNAILLRSNFISPLIQNNIIWNQGLQEGMLNRVSNSNQFGMGIELRCSGAIAQFNDIRNCGYAGIEFFGNNILIQNNFIDSTQVTMSDGGGIYTWVGTLAGGGIGSANAYTGWKILHNIVLHAIGHREGSTFSSNVDTALHQATCIYLDDLVGHGEVAYNTAAYGGISAFYIHNNKDVNVHDNTFFNSNRVMTMENNLSTTEPMTLMIYKHNIAFGVTYDANSLILNHATATQRVGVFKSLTNNIGSFGTIDSNYYLRPLKDSLTISVQRSDTNSANIFQLTLPQWKAMYGYDLHSVGTPVTITDVNDIKFEYNNTNVTVVRSVAYKGKNAKNQDFDGSVTLAPYASEIIIRTGNATGVIITPPSIHVNHNNIPH